jgi:uncharacterized protein YgbK (DUF1537 family)
MPAVSKTELFASLPPLNRESVMPAIQEAVRQSPIKLVVLDDDPTGTQTVRDVPVLTEWAPETLEAEFENDLHCFYILTNSRSLDTDSAIALNHEIVANLLKAADGRPFHVVSRSDSTLRGHYPEEVDTLSEGLGPFDGVLLIPYFEAGGRYTIDDIHYVADRDDLVPASETPFAADATFGYTNSNLRDWVEEKTKGNIKRDSVLSVPIGVVRREGPAGVAKILSRATAGIPVIINAAAPNDLEVVVAGLIEAENAGKRFLFRTGAQFVSTRIGLELHSLWEPPPDNCGTPNHGGLIMVGSHVPKSTAQLKHLLEHGRVKSLELKVEELLHHGANLEAAIATEAGEAMARGEDVVIYTSRDLVTGADPQASLQIANQVSASMVRILQTIGTRPAFLIAKGGITSSDLATKGLGIRRAMVLGPILPGVPAWETGSDTRFPAMPYIVFPGNVGNTESLLEAVEKFAALKK